MGDTIFSKIINKEIPADVVYESDTLLGGARHLEIIPAPTSPIILIAGFNSTSAISVHIWEGEYSLQPASY